MLRQLEPDPTPWVEIGLGLFAEPLALEDAGQINAALDRDIDHVAALVLVALDYGLHGPGVIASSTVLCRHLVTRSDVPPLDKIDRAIGFALCVRDMIAAQVDDGLLPRGPIVTQGRSVAALLHRAGRTDEAIAQLRAICDRAEEDWKDADDARSVNLLALIDLGAIADDARRRDLAQHVLDKLAPFIRDQESYDRNASAALAHIRSQLLRLLNRTDEAVAVNTAALDALDTDDVAKRLRADLHSAAAVLARDRGDGAATLQHEREILQYSRKSGGKRVSWHLAEALRSCADAAIDAKDLPQAIKLLTEAEDVARTTFGVTSREYGRFLAVLGRLNLERGHWEDARTDLQAAAAILRYGPEADRTELAVALVHLGQVRMFLDEQEHAARAFEEAIAIDTQAYGPDHPETLNDIQIRDGAPDAVYLHRQLYVVQQWQARTQRQRSSAGPRTATDKTAPITPIPDHVPFPGPTYER